MDEDLLQDLEELGGEDEIDDGLDEEAGEDGDNDMDEGEDGAEMEEDISAEEKQKRAALLESIKAANDVKTVAKLLHSKTLKDLIQKVDKFRNTPRQPAENVGPVEEDPEYKVIVQANNTMVDIDSEILIVHKFVRDHYSPKFPELESLILNPLDYARAVKAIGNEMDLTRVDLKATCGLPQATVMIVTVTATRTNGRPLTDQELAIVIEACNMAVELEALRKKFMEYVESRMNFIAPNLSVIVGSATAAKLMGLAGGLTALSKIPACNLQVLGKTSKVNTGLSAIGQQKHAGYIYYSDVVMHTPPEYRNKATRLVAAKCALASRIDAARESPDGGMGRQLREEIDKKIEKMQEPPPGKSVKALPVPDEGPKKRRAGKRVRRAKERLAITELRKAQNRMAFGVAEDEVGASTGATKGMGLIGGQTGKIRAAVADPRVKVNVAKRHRMIGSYSGGATSGLSSSLAFTPVQGIELENPEIQQQKLKEINERYFSGSFLKVGKKSDS
ncbi:U4/U6-U5 snRNP complex subunit prp31 [Quaeritorhiza haematococci]|nr:U4/U6-U5 snRNP complex subunit prp31 [Quaeritorhiza haematococci]